MTTDEVKRWNVIYEIPEAEYWGPYTVHPTADLVEDCLKRVGAVFEDGDLMDDPEREVTYRATESVHLDALELIKAVGVKILSADPVED